MTRVRMLQHHPRDGIVRYAHRYKFLVMTTCGQHERSSMSSVPRGAFTQPVLRVIGLSGKFLLSILWHG